VCAAVSAKPGGLRHARDTLVIAEREMQIHKAEASRLIGELLARVERKSAARVSDLPRDNRPMEGVERRGSSKTASDQP
jgi:hypothetical protein